jgi:hypothetical protein
MLAIQLVAILLLVPAFADASPGYADAQIGNEPIQLAQVDLPQIGSVDDYLHQKGDGPAANQSSPRYSPQSLPQRGYATQALPPPEWNNRFGADPNAQRNLLIGAAVVGAIAVGLWAYQQHQIRQAQRRSPKRFYGRRYRLIE